MTKFLHKYVYLIALVALLPAMCLRDVTPDNELRYLSIADEALQSGRFFAFTNHGIAYADKPPLYLWIVMLGKWLFGTHVVWFLSLFSWLPACVIVWLTDRWISAYVRMSEAWRSAGRLMLLTCGLFLGTGIVLRMDMLMTLFIVLALHTFFVAASDGTSASVGRSRWLFALYTFLALFVKGPVGLLIPVLTVVLFSLLEGRTKWLGWMLGWRFWLLLGGSCALWFGATYMEGGKDYLENLLFHQTLDRAVNAFHHKEPFYYYAKVVWYCMAPWSLLVVGTIVARVIWLRSWHPVQRFFLTEILVTWVMLSIFSSKLAVYLVPTFSFAVYLAVSLLDGKRWKAWMSLSLALPAAVFAGVLPGLLLLEWFFSNSSADYLNHPLVYVAAAVLSASGIGALYVLVRQPRKEGSITALAFGLLAALFVGGWSMPDLNAWMGYRAVCEKAMEVAREKEADGGFYVWKERRPENMDVYLHEDVHEVEAEDLPAIRRAVLMLPVKKLNRSAEVQAFLKGKEQQVVGKHLVVYCE